MAIRRPIRRLAALLAMAVLVFANLSVASYACPMQGMDPGDEVNVNLCDQSVGYGEARADTPKPAFPEVPATFVARILPAISLAHRSRAPCRVAEASGPEPPLVGTVVLRI